MSQENSWTKFTNYDVFFMILGRPNSIIVSMLTLAALISRERVILKPKFNESLSMLLISRSRMREHIASNMRGVFSDYKIDHLGIAKPSALPCACRLE